ncbi:MAG: hypothetical protein ABW328_16225 [Ilumatobacteraceae bacterium]
MVLRRRLCSLALLATLTTTTVVACSGGDDDATDAGSAGSAAALATIDTSAASAPALTGPTVDGTVTTTTSAATTSAATTSSDLATTTVAPTTAVAPPPPPTVAAPPTTVFPAVEAAAYAVFDPATGAFLSSNQPDAPLAVGSLMKLLAAQTAYAAGASTKVVVAPDGLIIDPEESRIGIRPAAELPRDLLIRAMLIVSANDAARLLALDIAGGEPQFAELMNQNAAALGLTGTHAVNATGLDADGQFSTAADMTRLAAFLMQNQTFQSTVKRTDATLNGQTYAASNDLLTTYPGADGIKTGHTTQAGWCVVASAQRNGRRMIVTVLGAPTEEARDAAATGLLDWAWAQVTATG